MQRILHHGDCAVNATRNALNVSHGESRERTRKLVISEPTAFVKNWRQLTAVNLRGYMINLLAHL